MNSTALNPDDETADALVLDPEMSEPVELIEEGDAAEPPDSWGQELDEADWDERYRDVEVTEDPEDGDVGG